MERNEMNKKQLRFSIILAVLILIFVAAGLYMSKTRPLAHLFDKEEIEETGGSEVSVDPLQNESSQTALSLAQSSRRAEEEEIQKEIVVSPYIVRARELLKSNGGKKAETLSYIYTTKRAVSFLFSGIGNAKTVDGVLSSLKKTNSVGMFFVTEDEIRQCDEQIRKIIAAKMPIGISYAAGAFNDAESLLANWLETMDLLSEQYGYQDVKYVRQISGSASDDCRTVVSAANLTLVQQNLEAIPTAAAYTDTGSEVIDLLFPDGKTNLQRGQMVHFRMDIIQNSVTVVPQVVTLLATEKTDYSVVALSDILEDTKLLYNWPLSEDQILPEVLNAIHPGQLTGKDELAAFSSRYIGIYWVDSMYFLPGFSSKEIVALDKRGKLRNDKNYVFLTFDDWGTDYSIDPILQVLKKHNVKATFFIRTSNVKYNPNLLRAIAMDGHDIASHTDTHFQLSNMVTNTKYSELSAEQRDQLEKDLVRSYEVLQSTIGDIRTSNGPALTRYFRPPTLAVSRSGLRTVLDCGFTYSISGSYTTGDYNATSAKRLSAQMMDNTSSGAVLVLHMSETAEYTAEAVDLYLTELEAQGRLKAVPLSAFLK